MGAVDRRRCRAVHRREDQVGGRQPDRRVRRRRSAGRVLDPGQHPDYPVDHWADQQGCLKGLVLEDHSGGFIAKVDLINFKILLVTGDMKLL